MAQLYYHRQTRERLEACRDKDKPETFTSINEQRQLERLDDHQIYAEEVTTENPWYDNLGNPIPEGDFAITRSDGVVFRSERDWFLQTWAPYADLTEPLANDERTDIPA